MASWAATWQKRQKQPSGVYAAAVCSFHPAHVYDRGNVDVMYMYTHACAPYGPIKPSHKYIIHVPLILYFQ